MRVTPHLQQGPLAAWPLGGGRAYLPGLAAVSNAQEPCMPDQGQ